MMTDREVLQAAQNLIRKPENWLQFNSVNGDLTAFCATGAVYWTLTGRERRRMSISELDTYYRVVNILTDVMPEGSPYTYVTELNDQSTHDQVMELFDRALQTLNERALHEEKEEPCLVSV